MALPGHTAGRHILANYASVGILGVKFPLQFRFPPFQESKPSPLEGRNGWGTRHPAGLAELIHGTNLGELVKCYNN